MKKTLLRFSLLSMLVTLCLGVHAETYDNVEATFSWTVGNEAAATISGEVTEAVKQTKVKAGSGLTVGTNSSYAANPGHTMVTYNPTKSKPGAVADAMIEYTVKMKKGVTFKLESVSYDALKDGTDNAEYSWSYTVDGAESAVTVVTKDKLVRNNNTTGNPPLNHVESIEATAGNTVTFRVYVSGFDSGKKLGLSNIAIKGKVNGTPVVRTFTDFKIEFRNNPYTVLLPTTGELPTGVVVNPGNYNGGQHGVQAPVITVPVDGPVKFTIGACQYSTTDITISDTNGGSTTFSNKAACGEQMPNYNQYVVYTYNVEEATTLTFTFGSQSFVPYFFAEACDYIESCEVIYYDTDGKTVISKETVDGGSELKYKFGAGDVTVPDGCAFRGWFSGTGKAAVKIAEGTTVDADLALYAKATEVETPALGKVFKYDLTKPYFYEEDHEAFINNGGSFHDAQHGWSWGNGKSFAVDVAGKAQIVIGLCLHSSDTPITVTDGNSATVTTIPSGKAATDGATTSIKYDGEATRLTFTVGGTTYIHNVAVYNVSQFVEKDAESGYYIIPANDGASLTLAMASASASTEADPVKIFLPNGTYDIDGSDIDGNANIAALTMSGKYTSLIGESREGVLVKTHISAEQESLKSALLAINGEYNYIQDVTLQNYADFNASTKAERANALRDIGNYSMLNNVYLKGTQDVYLTYRNKGNVAQKIYYKGGKIEGTVDFICGAGDVFFDGVNLYCANSATAGKTTGDYICAPATYDYENFGYTFNKCVIDGESTQAGTYYLVRTWQNDPKATYIDVDYSALAPNSALFITMNDQTTTDKCHSYASTDAEAANYTMEKVLGDDFAALAKASTAQVEAPEATYDSGNVTWTPANNGATAYMILKNGTFAGITTGNTFAITIDTEKDALSIRAANGRGGFGEAKQVKGTATGIHAAKAATERGEQVIYNLAGQRVSKASQGLYIVNGKKMILK